MVNVSHWWVRISKFLWVILPGWLAFCCSPHDHDYLVYVGTYTGKESDGIYVYRFNSVRGDLNAIGLAAKTENPSYLVIDAEYKFLYAVNETDQFNGAATGAISTFAINKESGALTLLQQVSSLGEAPCHLSFDHTGRYLMVANYNGGNAAVFPISPDGTLDQPSAFVQSKGSSINAVRQSGPHAHSIQPSPDNRFVLITDLGIDKVLIYSFDEKTGFLEGNDSMHASLTPGSGPRHLSFAPSGKYAFVINELSSTATVSSWDALTGRMVPGQSISTLPDNFTGTNTGAEILTVNGKYLYTSNRGDDSITLFNIDGIDGHLTQVERVSSGGLTPRHFEIDPTGRWLLAANQGSGKLVLFSIEPSSGRLKTSGKQLDQPSPVCVRFIPVH